MTAAETVHDMHIERVARATENVPELALRHVFRSGKRNPQYVAQFIYDPGSGYQKFFSTCGFDTTQELADVLVNTLENKTMANIFKMTGDLFKYLTAEMLPDDGKPVAMTIRDVHAEELENQRGKQTRPIITFKETDKAFVLGNKTNVRMMVDLLGAETDDWIGKRISVYRTTVQAFGKQQPAIRIKPQLPAQNGKGGKRNGNEANAQDVPLFDDAAETEQDGAYAE